MPLEMIHFVPGTSTRSSAFFGPQTNSRPPLAAQSAAFAAPATHNTASRVQFLNAIIGISLSLARKVRAGLLARGPQRIELR